MRKRLIIPISILLGVTAIFLVAAIFKLYTEAEKVQKSIFTSEIISAGDDIINKIDAILKGDTLPAKMEKTPTSLSDTVPQLLQQTSKKFLLDSLSQPIGLIYNTITYKDYNSLISQADTTYFDTNYRKSFPYLPLDWELHFEANKFEDKQTVKRPNRYKYDINKIEMDTATRELLNRDFLNRIIKESLGDIILQNKFDFALYNGFTTDFVIPPALVNPDKILTSAFVFTLKSNDRFLTPHFLILYFPTERGIYFQMMGAIGIMIVVFLTLILIISGFTLFYLHKQKKITDVRNDFVNNMTHEFKTPIATISLACEAVSDESTMEDQALRQSYISIIKDENERLQNMVTNILQLAQLKKGQLRMNFKKVDMHEMIKSIAESVMLQVTSNNGVLVLKLNAAHSFVDADVTHLENALINLIENAVKYSPKNPMIEISTKNEKKYLVISVKDNGIGISKKNIKKIFQEFYRVSKGNIHNTKGFGLGLDYVKKIVMLHNGSITVKSELNEGTIFTLYLPLKND